MNIFVTSECPKLSAQFLDNKRLVKMVLESAQLLSTSLALNGVKSSYRVTHVNHPCSIWARETRGNYIWLLSHFVELCNEYTRRYGKVHKCTQYTAFFISHRHYIPFGELMPFVNCAANKSLGLNFKNVNDTTLAYKLYLFERFKADVKPATCSLNLQPKKNMVY